ncbi:MAG: tRNA(Ile)(2)-agmatinylcytidine synthase [Nitrososphaerota archaeon]
MLLSVVWIGVDDTDSKKRGCTTYVGAQIIKRLESRGYSLSGYPKLVRLNPNCSYKTRGNAAISMMVEIENEDFEDVKDTVLGVVEEFSEMDEDETDPGVVFYKGDPPQILREFYWHTVRDISSIDLAMKIIREISAEAFWWKTGRGVIGALAAIGVDLSKKKTYELIAYRRKEYWGAVRMIDEESVWEMDKATYPLTFDNVDKDSGEIRIAPHTPCPVLFGIRGLNPEILKKAYSMVKVYEPVEFYVIYETNQATDAHLQPVKICEAKDGVSAIIRGYVKTKPRFTVGGHVFFELEDETGKIHCAAYEPTKNFRHIVAQLEVGDEVIVYGAVKLKPQGLTVNLEKIEVLSLVDIFSVEPPLCDNCGRKMIKIYEEMYMCKECKTSSSTPILRKVQRTIRPGVYEVPPSARRHLSMPLALSRYYEHRQGTPNLIQSPNLP